MDVYLRASLCKTYCSQQCSMCLRLKKRTALAHNFFLHLSDYFCWLNMTQRFKKKEEHLDTASILDRFFEGGSHTKQKIKHR